jgi:hypothetical protein
MTSRSKRHGLRLSISSAGEVEAEEGAINNIDRYFLLQVSCHDEKSNEVKRFKELNLFRLSLGEVGERVDRRWPEADEVHEMRTEELAPLLDIWFNDFLSEGPPLNRGVVCQLKSFLGIANDKDKDMFLGDLNRTSLIDRKFLFTRHNPKKHVKVGRLNSKGDTPDSVKQYFVSLDDNLCLYENEHECIDGGSPITTIGLTLFWISEDKAEGDNHYFTVRTPGQIVTFWTDVESEAASWVETLRSVHIT